MGTHPTFSPTTGPAASYQPKTTDESDSTVAGGVVPHVNAQGPILGTLADPATSDITTNSASFTFTSLFKGMVANLLAIKNALSGLLTVDTVVKGTAASRSGTITAGGTAQQLMAANAARRGFRIQNQSSGALYFNANGTATLDQNSFLLNAGDYFETSTQFVGTGAVSIIGATSGAAFHAAEF